MWLYKMICWRKISYHQPRENRVLGQQFNFYLPLSSHLNPVTSFNSTESSIKISAADVEVVTMELEVSKEEAHTALLKENGDVIRALRRLLH